MDEVTVLKTAFMFGFGGLFIWALLSVMQPSEYWANDYDDDDEDEPEDEKVIRSQLLELTSNSVFMTKWVYHSESDKFVLTVEDDVLSLSDTFLEINGVGIDCGYRLDDEIEASYDRMTEFTEDEERVSQRIRELMTKVLHD